MIMTGIPDKIFDIANPIPTAINTIADTVILG